MSAAVETFRKLHESDCFTIPNPWDIGSAKRLERLGFEALASSSAAAAWTLGKDDGELTFDEVLDHLRMLVAATPLPVNADFENGFADAPDDVAANVARCVDTGVAGLSVEDWSGKAIYDADTAVARIAAARAAIDRSGTGALLVGRAECVLRGVGGLDDAIARLRAYSAAGADVLYTPGVVDPAEVAQIVAAVAPKPVNVLIYKPGQRVADYAAAGARRCSVGSALAWFAWEKFDRVAAKLASEGGIA